MGAEQELQELRQRIELLERERAEEIARANAAAAAAQDRTYWLDRLNIDLNAVMSRRGVGELLAVGRALRALLRRLGRLRGAASSARTRARQLVAEERERARPAPADRDRV
jgi:hypothetical protein